MLKFFLLFIILFLNSCNKKSFYKETKVFMNTIFTITVPYENKNIIEELFKIIEENENLYFSTFKESSEIFKINKILKTCKNKNIDFQISNKLKNILKYSKQYKEETNGAFNVNYKIISDYWTNNLKNNKIPDEASLTELLKYLEENPYTLNKNTLNAKCGLEFGFGAIAKGYTLEELYIYLKNKNISNFLIDAGGDILSAGTKNNKPWTISVLNPNNKEKPYANCLFDTNKISILSSASYYRFTELNGVKYSHILNLKTGKAAQGKIVSISIISDNPIRSDAYATALYTEPYEKILANFENYYKKRVGIILSTQNKVYLNSIAKKYCN